MTTFYIKPPFTPLIHRLPSESEPYVAFQSQLPYDNAVSVRRLHSVLTCSSVVVFLGLRKQRASQGSGSRLSLPLMRPSLSHRGGITPIIYKHIRFHAVRCDGLATRAAARRENLCCFSPAAKAQQQSRAPPCTAQLDSFSRPRAKTK